MSVIQDLGIVPILLGGVPSAMNATVGRKPGHLNNGGEPTDSQVSCLQCCAWVVDFEIYQSVMF